MAAKKQPAVPAVATTSIPFWDSNADVYEQFEPVGNWSPWDTAILAGLRVPGVVRVSSRKRRRVSQPGAIGSQTVEMVDVGVEPVQVEFHCTLWRPEHLQQYAALADSIEVRVGKTPAAYAVVHPGLAMLKIAALYITAVGVPQPLGPGGAFSAVIEAQNYVRNKKDAAKGVYAVDQSKLVQTPKNAIEQGMRGGGAPSGVPAFLKPNP